MRLNRMPESSLLAHEEVICRQFRSIRLHQQAVSRWDVEPARAHLQDVCLLHY